MSANININTLLAILAFVTAVGSGFYWSGDLQARSENQERDIRELTRDVEALKAAPMVDTGDLEKTVSIVLTKVENLSGSKDAIQSIKEDVVKLNVEVQQLSKSINGIPNEFPTLQQKVSQLSDAINKLEDKNNK